VTRDAAIEAELDRAGGLVLRLFAKWRDLADQAGAAERETLALRASIIDVGCGVIVLAGWALGSEGTTRERKP